MPVILKSNTNIFKVVKNNFNQLKCNKFFSTIYSLSSGLNSSLKSKPGVAIAVVRISGPETATILEKFTKGQSKNFFSSPRKANLISLYNVKNNELIDKCIGIWFPKPASYTGEDMCEFYLHGSQAIVSTVLKNLSYFKNTNPAENGEFTKRSFLNKKISLIQAEAINDLIESTNDSQRKNALEGLDGKIIKRYENWRKKLIQLHAYVEATIEFGEDQLLDEERIDKTINNLFNLKEEIEKFLINSSKKRKMLKNGMNICILGKPNVGKSSLMNKICDQDLSIVSPYEGTTRDVIQYSLNISGFNVFLNDTAGLRNLENSNENYVENKGIELALERAKEADIILYVIDASKFNIKDDLTIKSLENDEKSFLNKKIIYVFNKIDLIDNVTQEKIFKFVGEKKNLAFLSCSTNKNLDKLVDILIEEIKLLEFNQNSDHVSFITERHENHLLHIKDNINDATAIYKEDYGIASFYIKNAINELGLILGVISTEQILDVIFKDFCIGK